MAKKTPDSGQSISFSEQLSSLEQLVQRIESGALSLEESVQAYQAGTALLKQCQVTLAEAEQTVLILNQEQALTTFAPDALKS